MPDPVFLSGADVPDYLKGVELLTAGMEWQASTGTVTLTLEHLADAVRAFSDPHIQPPRIKLGHGSPVNGDAPDHDPFAAIGDAEPSFGQFTNLRLVNDGAVLVGDAENIPAWLAEMAPSAYPNRSSEGTWNVVAANTDVQTNGGRRYSFVLTAVSLLGVYLPAVSDLEDLQALIVNGPSALEAKTPVAAAADASLSVSHATIRDRFNWEWAVEREGNDFEGDTTWWWARDVRVDPDEIIADDEEGHLWAVPFTTDGEDAITFGEPARVRQTYVPVAAAQVVSFSRPDKKAERPAAIAAATNKAATGRPDPEEENPMDERVREFLVGQGHDPETATDQQITAAEAYVAAFPDATGSEPPAEDPTAPEGEPQGEVEGGEPQGDAEPTSEPVAASKPDPIAAAQKQAFDSLAAEVASLRAERDATNLAATKQRRDGQIDTALSTGRITPAEREHYRSLLDVDEERAGALLSALPAGRVPMEARAQIPDPEAEQFSADQPLPDGVSLLNPSERAALKARRAV